MAEEVNDDEIWKRIRKTIWTMVYFITIAILALLVVFAGLNYEVKQCKERLTICESGIQEKLYGILTVEDYDQAWEREVDGNGTEEIIFYTREKS